MKPPRPPLLFVSSFAPALAAVWLWPAGDGSAPLGKTTASAGRSSGANGAAVPSEDAARKTNAAGAPGSTGSAPAAPAGPAPTMDEVFAATGLDRMLLMARFIQTASSGELAEVIDRATAENSNEPTFADQAWLRWVEIDREAALRHTPPGEAWWAWTKLDADAALKAALEKGDAAVLGQVFHSIGQRDPARAKRLLEEHPEADPILTQAGILQGLEHTDPAAAITLALEMGQYRVNEPFQAWMTRDPDAALAWMRGLTDPGQRRQLEDLAIAQITKSDPAAGLKAARELPLGSRQLTGTVAAIAALARQDPSAARAAAEALPAGYGRQTALAALAGTLAASDPAAAAAMLPSLDWKALGQSGGPAWVYTDAENKRRHSGSNGEPASHRLVEKLAAGAPRAAADALATLPVESGAPLSSLLRKWAGTEPEAASSWLKDQPPGPARDQGIQGLTRWLVQENPEPDFPAAMAWAGAASPEAQSDLYNLTLEQWRRHDPKAAAAAVDQLPISDEIHTRLMRQFR